MLIVFSEIYIVKRKTRKAYLIRGISKIKIVGTWQEFTSTAEVSMPQQTRLREFSTNKVNLLINAVEVNDEILIGIQYRGGRVLKWSGFVTRIQAKRETTLFCEDLMYLLKTTSTNYTIYNQDLRQVMSKALRNISYNNVRKVQFDDKVPLSDSLVNEGIITIQSKDAIYGETDFRETGISIDRNFEAKPLFIPQIKSTGILPIIDLLSLLKKSYGIYSFFLNDRLYVGNIHQKIVDYGIEHTFTFNSEQSTVIDSKFKYIDKDSIKYSVVAKDLKSKKQITVGSKGGVTRNIAFYGVGENGLRNLANDYLDSLSYTGITGSFTTFGHRAIKHGDTVVLSDDKDRRKNGKYFVNKVITTLANGIKQEIFLGLKV